VKDRPWFGCSIEVRKGSRDECRGDPRRATRPSPLVARPQRASAQLDAAELDPFVLVSGVKDHPQVTCVEQVPDTTSMLEDARISRRLEQVDLGHPETLRQVLLAGVLAKGLEGVV
jgi:hypothetical protein